MIVLPDGHLLAGALAAVGIEIDPAVVPGAHYRAVRIIDHAVRTLDHARPASPTAPTQPTYAAALFHQLGILPGQAAEALAVWQRLADRSRADAVLWSEPTPNARRAIDALRRAGLTVVIVTNSDGHAAENLADCGFGDVPVIDSTIVGAAKPDAEIFSAALARARLATADPTLARLAPAEAVHVGDTLTDDVAGARAARITPIHFDPLRACRARDHRHVRSLAGLWHHIAR